MKAILSDILDILRFVKVLASWIREILGVSPSEGREQPSEVERPRRAETSSPIVTNPVQPVSVNDKLGKVSIPRFRFARR